MTRWLPTLILVALVTLYGAPAAAQGYCDTRDSIVARLGDKYGEVRHGYGLAGPTAIFEIWTSDVTGSWTILKTAPNNWTCIIAVGDNWHNEPEGDPI